MIKYGSLLSRIRWILFMVSVKELKTNHIYSQTQAKLDAKTEARHKLLPNFWHKGETAMLYS